MFLEFVYRSDLCITYLEVGYKLFLHGAVRGRFALVDDVNISLSL